MFDIGFLRLKSLKVMEKWKVRSEKPGTGAKRNGLQACYFFKWNWLLPFLFFLISLFLLWSGCLSYQFWVLKVTYDFSCPVLVAYKKKWIKDFFGIKLQSNKGFVEAWKTWRFQSLVMYRIWGIFPKQSAVFFSHLNGESLRVKKMVSLTVRQTNVR